MTRLLQLFFFLVLFAFGVDGSIAGFSGFKGSYKGTVVISAYSVTPSSTTATVNWTNTPAATGRVCYGLTSALGTCTTRDASPVTTDSASLSGLSASTTYYYQIDATATGLTQGFSLLQTFSTTPASGCAFGTAFPDGCPTAVANGSLYFAPWSFPTVAASSPVAAGATVTIPISGSCPSATQYENAAVTDTTANGSFVGNVGSTSGSCVSNTSITLTAVNAIAIASSDTLKLTNPLIPVAQPTAAQFATYATPSGQTWISSHPQPWNVVCEDYACGPNIPVLSMADAAGWTQGTDNCAYLSAADGYTGSNTPGWTGTGHVVSGNTSHLIIDSTTTGTATPGMFLIPGPSGVGAGSVILSGSGTGGSPFILNKTQSISTGTPEALTATNSYYGGGAAGSFQPVFTGAPVLVCTGSSTSAFTINGFNFGPSTYQGSPVGVHDCINLIFLPSSVVSYASEVDITNNAFIAGKTCNLVESTTGQVVNITNPLLSNTKFYSNFVWGRGIDPCCASQINYPFSLTKQLGDMDLRYNWVYQTTDGFASPGFSAGGETSAALATCSNPGSAYSWPGYTFTENFNYVDTFGSSYNGAHMEWGGFGNGTSNTESICSAIQDYNVSVMIPPMPNEALGTWLGFGSFDIGTAEYNEQIGNTVIANMVGGKSSTHPEDWYQYLTSGCPTLSALCPSGSGPNTVIVTGYGSSCGGNCTAPVPGQGTNGDIGFVVQVSTTPTGFGTWTAGCNQTFGTLCTTEQPALNPNIQYPGGNTSETASGTVSSGTSTSIVIASSTCPSSTKYIGAILSDGNLPNGNNQIGIVTNCTANTPSGKSTITLSANNAFTVTSGDALTLWTAIVNGPFNNTIASRVLSDMGHGSDVFVTVATTGSTSTSSKNVTLASCPTHNNDATTLDGGLNNTVVNDQTTGQFIGETFTCVSGAVTLYANAASAVGSGDTLSFASFAFGSLVRYQNYLDTTGSLYTYDTDVTVHSGQTVFFASGSGGGTSGGGGCAFPMDYGHGTSNINVLLTTGAEALPSSTNGKC